MTVFRNVEEIYKARLASVVYRDMILEFKASKIRKKDANGNDIIEEDGVPMGFDTGSDLTWFSSTLHDFIVQAVSSVQTSYLLQLLVWGYRLIC